MFLNLSNNTLSLNSYSFPSAECTTLQDLIECYKKQVLPENIFTTELVANVKHLHLSNSYHDINVLVDYDAKLDSNFVAYDIDTKEIIFVNGWAFDYDYNSNMTL